MKEREIQTQDKGMFLATCSNRRSLQRYGFLVIEETSKDSGGGVYSSCVWKMGVHVQK